jgi:hypothetical protein
VLGFFTSDYRTLPAKGGVGRSFSENNPVHRSKLALGMLRPHPIFCRPRSMEVPVTAPKRRKPDNRAGASDSANEVTITPERVVRATGTDDADVWHRLVRQAIDSLWLPAELGEEEGRRRIQSAISLMAEIKPQDGVEGMLAVQMVATHEAAMECLRRAMLPEQTSMGHDMALKHGTKLLTVFARQLEALNRHRGKGQQKVTVEHVHVHSGGQAVVGVVEPPGGGDCAKSEEQPHAKQIAHAPQPAMRRADEGRERVPVAGNAERPLPAARRPVAGPAEAQ